MDNDPLKMIWHIIVFSASAALFISLICLLFYIPEFFK